VPARQEGSWWVWYARSQLGKNGMLLTPADQAHN
jgi:hypothetical protein